MIDSLLDQMQIGQSVALATGQRARDRWLGNVPPAVRFCGRPLGRAAWRYPGPAGQAHLAIATKFHFGICGLALMSLEDLPVHPPGGLHWHLLDMAFCKLLAAVFTW
jgi:hypothetical protein